MKQYFIFSLTAFMLAILLPAKVQADQRQFVWTYEYLLMERGEAEIESYYTLESPESGNMKGITTSKHDIELEIGMTERYDFGIYYTFEQKHGEELKHTGFKLRGRYRTGPKAGSFVKPIIYFEYKSNPDFSKQKLEFKPIVGKTLGNYTVAINPVFEIEHEDEWDSMVVKYRTALGYRLDRYNSIGVDLTGSETGHYIGPVISHGRHNLWMALGSGFKISKIDEGKPELQIRLLMGIGISSSAAEGH